jgi:hypothetical protein
MNNFAGIGELPAPFAERLRWLCVWTVSFWLIWGTLERLEAQQRFQRAVPEPTLQRERDWDARADGTARVEQIGSGAVWVTGEDPLVLAHLEEDPAGWMTSPGAVSAGGVPTIVSDGGEEFYVSDGRVWDGSGWVEPWYPNRPYLIPRVVDRLRWRPLFPHRPHLRGSWPGGPPLEQPRTFWLNPFALQQGVGNLLFRGNQPADPGSLGFSFFAGSRPDGRPRPSAVFGPWSAVRGASAH